MLAALFTFVTSLPSWINGLFGTINHVTDAIANKQIALINAQSDEDRVLINAQLSALIARRDLMIAESAHSKLNIYVRSFLAFGPASILFKILFWDKVVGSFVGCSGKLAVAASCGMFVTDPLDPNLWNVVMVVVSFYFLADGAATVSRILKLPSK